MTIPTTIALFASGRRNGNTGRLMDRIAGELEIEVVDLDRHSDLLEVPELLDHGRKLRDKKTYVVCTSVSEEPDAPFLEAFVDTFA